MDVKHNASGIALDLDLRDACGVELLLKRLSEIVILDQRVAEILVAHIPAGIPVLDDAHAQTVGMNFLAHKLTSFDAYSASLSTRVTWDVFF